MATLTPEMAIADWKMGSRLIFRTSNSQVIILHNTDCSIYINRINTVNYLCLEKSILEYISRNYSELISEEEFALWLL